MSNKHRPLPSVSILRSLLRYDPIAGSLFCQKTGARGSLTTKGYIQFTFLGINWKAHRLIWALVTGEDPGKDEIDHRNGRGSDNSWGNLRRACRSEQTINSRLSSRNTSTVKGVHLIKTRGIYSVKISKDKIGYHLGEFASLEDAATTRLMAELCLHGEYRRTNVESEATRLGITLPESMVINARIINHRDHPHLQRDVVFELVHPELTTLITPVA